MIVKACVAGALALALLPQLVPHKETVAQTYIHPYVKRVMCDEGSGTAFMIPDGRYVSVHHVTVNSNCTIDGKPFKILHHEARGDFSVLEVENPRGAGIPIDCGGFRHGQPYHALGYGEGRPQSVPLFGNAILTFLYGGGAQHVLSGFERVIPGQSGGPVIDADGRVVGTVNARGKKDMMSWSRPLSQTILCQG